MKPSVDKVAEVERLVALREWPGALKIAAGFKLRGDERTAIQRAWSSLRRPDFHRELGQDPEANVSAGISALQRRWGSETPPPIPELQPSLL